MKNTAQFQHAVSRFVEQNVIYCVSYLFYELIQKAEHFPDEQEDLYDLTSTKEYEDPAYYEGWRMRGDDESDGFYKEPDHHIYEVIFDPDLITVNRREHPDNDGTLFWSVTRQMIGDKSFDDFEEDYDNLFSYLVDNNVLTIHDKLVADYEVESEFETSDAESWEELCSNENIDPYDREIYEHWIVTGYLARRLQAHGETVKDIFNMKIWGRATTGQSISIDGVIEEIYKEEYPEEFNEQGEFIGS